MVDPEVALPDIIDIKLTPYASKALSTGRKKFEPLYFKFTHSNGLPALKGMIETKLNTAIPTMLQNNEQVQYFASNTTANAQRMPVKMWTYLDALYLKSKNNASQLNYEQITTTNEFETMLKGTWANSFKGAGKAARTNIQRDYDAALLLSQSDLTVEAPQIPILFRFQLFVYLELLYGQVLQLPVDVVSLRVALGLPHLDLQHMPEGEAVIDRNAPIPNDIQNMPDTDHQRGVDLAEAAP